MFKKPHKSSRAFQAKMTTLDFDPRPRGMRVTNEFSKLPGTLTGKVQKALLSKIIGHMGGHEGNTPLELGGYPLSLENRKHSKYLKQRRFNSKNCFT